MLRLPRKPYPVSKVSNPSIDSVSKVYSSRGVGSKNIQKEIRTEMAVFEQQGVKGPSLPKCYKYLRSIPPTSVESERCFSASGNIVTKLLRCSMNDDTLDAISFLRSHFINRRKWGYVEHRVK
jgi:hAT family C-terminal dimerisation region